ncbi:CubicO group peptidase (beta-lactamase class C family) [Roseivirga pacifica]|uniref:CubicO group peptidase, beta-lactamase class C family n=1 Tax=Roseivirga pacifica TaxID=1267423 RepID=A0A1I0QA99_9BACT|nr:serine hydrolase domain-containing protein [Roseivirga pacifica]RKQ43109.1 CubicO group peptidase (beta-lactamase class C family) [Roseivirga pacifica]SEW23815.1 CubicO group peptidase, beta-lactamase class C family [Roseivirga pacifica]
MKALTYFSFLLCAAAIMVSCSSSEQETAQVIDVTAKARIDSTLTAFVANGKVAGASALIYEDGKEVYFGAFGFADKEARRPMDRNTIVKVYSMTKPITGTALMTLYEQGKFDLDDPLAKYAPEFADMTVYVGRGENGEYLGEPLERPITIRDLTRHTAGFGTNTNIPGLGDLIADADASNWNNTLTEMAEKMGQTPLWFQPGTQWQYGPSVDVQAFLVERISGQTYHEYVREHVLDPLRMEETRYVVPQKDIDRFSASYTQTESGLTQLPNEEAHAFNLKKWPLTPGGFGLTSTLDDYMKFAQMLVNNGTLKETTILEPETVKLMATNHLDENIEERSWLPSKGQVGFGIDFAVRLREPQSAEENNGVVGEFFWDGAATTLFWVDPVNKLTAVFFVQVFPFDGTLHKGFRDAVYGPVKVASKK